MNHVVLERLRRQCTISESLDELVMGVAVPYWLDIFAVEQVFDEATSSTCMSVLSLDSMQITTAYGAKGRVLSEWKWFRGPDPSPRPMAVLMPAST